MRSWIVCLTTSLLLAAPASLQGQQATDPGQVKPSADPHPATDAPTAQPATQPANARELLASFATLQGLQARFVETRHLSLLAVPLVSKGRLYFSAPGYLLRTVDTPEPSSLLIEPNKLHMTNREGTESIDLRQSEGLRLFVTSLVRVFSGDEKALAEHYTMAFEARDDDSGWTFSLTPKEAPLNRMIRELSLTGTGFGVSTIVVVEPGGDRSVTTLSEVDSARVFSDEERLELFGIAPR